MDWGEESGATLGLPPWPAAHPASFPGSTSSRCLLTLALVSTRPSTWPGVHLAPTYSPPGLPEWERGPRAARKVGPLTPSMSQLPHSFLPLEASASWRGDPAGREGAMSPQVALRPVLAWDE